jgi:hypothetical protein
MEAVMIASQIVREYALDLFLFVGCINEIKPVSKYIFFETNLIQRNSNSGYLTPYLQPSRFTD